MRPGVRTGTVLSWLRRLLPAALLLVAPVGLPDPAGAITIDADEVAGPLSLADALVRHAGDRSAGGVSGPGVPTG